MHPLGSLPGLGLLRRRSPNHPTPGWATASWAPRWEQTQADRAAWEQRFPFLFSASLTAPCTGWGRLASASEPWFQVKWALVRTPLPLSSLWEVYSQGGRRRRCQNLDTSAAGLCDSAFLTPVLWNATVSTSHTAEEGILLNDGNVLGDRKEAFLTLFNPASIIVWASLTPAMHTHKCTHTHTHTHGLKYILIPLNTVWEHHNQFQRLNSVPATQIYEFYTFRVKAATLLKARTLVLLTLLCSQLFWTLVWKPLPSLLQPW